MQLAIRRRLADRIWQWRKVTYAGSTAVVALAIVAVCLSISSPSSKLQISSEPTFFDSSRAYRTASELSGQNGYPVRPTGSKESAAAASWYANKLASLKIPHSTIEFIAKLGYSSMTLHNVSVVLPGESTEAILISAPRDSHPKPQLDPLSDAGGTAMLLDLCQVFMTRPHEKTLIFLSSEGAAFGGLGLEYFLKTDPRAADVRTILSIQGLGKERREKLNAAVSGPDSSTPGWFTQLVSETLGDAGIDLQLPGLLNQVADHALGLAQGEQAAGLSRGIPSLSINDWRAGKVTATGMATQGAAVERMILSLDSGTELPSDPGTAVVTGSGRYLTSRALNILGLLMLLPAVLMALTWLAVVRMRPDAWLRYLRNLVSFALPMSAVLVIALLMSYAGLIPRYVHRASVFSPAAVTPSLPVALLLVVLMVVLFFVSRHFLGYLRPREPLVMGEMAKLSTGLVVLVTGLVLLSSHSPFSLLTGITAAWITPLATCFAEPKRTNTPYLPRFRTNAWLLLAGLIAPVLFYLYLPVEAGIGWSRGWWFLLVQTISGAYGFRGPVAAVLITAAFFMLSGVKRLQLLPIETLEDADDLSMVKALPPRSRGARHSQPAGTNEQSFGM